MHLIKVGVMLTDMHQIKFVWQLSVWTPKTTFH